MQLARSSERQLVAGLCQRVTHPGRRTASAVKTFKKPFSHTSHQHSSLAAISLLPLWFLLLQSISPPLAPCPFTWAACRKSLNSPVQFSPSSHSAPIDVHSLLFNSPSHISGPLESTTAPRFNNLFISQFLASKTPPTVMYFEFGQAFLSLPYVKLRNKIDSRNV